MKKINIERISLNGAWEKKDYTSFVFSSETTIFSIIGVHRIWFEIRSIFKRLA